ncbi:Aspartate/methionine/tyrosine aminotransferase [Pseudonocardia thermophila]|uniref:Aminotransferase n=1 Tax=Pseudonocardia thermophila TaxID=1848 RepID=A0A1M6P657_PSETH|nr:pyridoxal phosphate-dependent aminotransferase [Pseudonocardia thermophila]SHK03424.1 Aspartate/methionine/tyrosine aminotransferase [Pseudonocardia thermophila]
MTATSTTATAAPSFEHLLARPGLVWMGQNTTHLEPPTEVVAALEESVRRREFQLYAPALGFARLRELIVADLGLDGADAWITDGAVGGLHHICTALAGSISRVVTTDPGWPWPERFAGLSGVPTTTIDIYSAEQGYRITAAQIAEVIEPGSLIYLIDPLNPLGSRYERSDLAAITEVARETGSLLVHDCTYRHFADGHTLAAELYPEGTFTTYSFSKWLGLAGLRVGAVVAAPELLTKLTAVPANPLGASITAQRAAIAGLEVKDAWLARVRATNRRNQETVRAAVESSGLGRLVVWPSHGNFVAVDIDGSGWTADALCAAMLDRDVFIRPGTYQSPHFGTRFVKISTSVPEEWGDRFAAAWTDLPDPVGAR